MGTICVQALLSYIIGERINNEIESSCIVTVIHSCLFSRRSAKL